MLSTSTKVYLHAMSEKPSIGITSGIRPEPSLDEARAELSEAIIRLANSAFSDDFGPLLSVVSQPAIYECLRDIEIKLSRTKEQFSLTISEILERTMDFQKRNS